MGKSLKNSKLVQRTGKLAFYKVLGENKYHRMQGFTSLDYSQNPKEYSRQYVDEDFERTDITGYSPSIAYSFDKYIGNPVLEDLVKITEDELVGEKMVREIINVDMTTVNTLDGVSTANAKIRSYSVIPDSNSDTTDCLTYSGNFKSRGESEDCIVTSSDNWETITYVSRDIPKSSTAKISVNGDGVSTPIGGSTGSINGTVAVNSEITITVEPDYKYSTVHIFKDNGSSMTSIAKGVGTVSSAGLNVASGSNHYQVMVQGGESSNSYGINITGE